MRRLEVLHVLPSLVVKKNKMEEEALRRRDVGGGERKVQSLITLASLRLV